MSITHTDNDQNGGCFFSPLSIPLIFNFNWFLPLDFNIPLRVIPFLLQIFPIFPVILLKIDSKTVFTLQTINKFINFSFTFYYLRRAIKIEKCPIHFMNEEFLLSFHSTMIFLHFLPPIFLLFFASNYKTTLLDGKSENEEINLSYPDYSVCRGI